VGNFLFYITGHRAIQEKNAGFGVQRLRSRRGQEGQWGFGRAVSAGLRAEGQRNGELMCEAGDEKHFVKFMMTSDSGYFSICRQAMPEVRFLRNFPRRIR
jgi:hypothetical protein